MRGATTMTSQASRREARRRPPPTTASVADDVATGSSHVLEAQSDDGGHRCELARKPPPRRAADAPRSTSRRAEPRRDAEAETPATVVDAPRAAKGRSRRGRGTNRCREHPRCRRQSRTRPFQRRARRGRGGVRIGPRRLFAPGSRGGRARIATRFGMAPREGEAPDENLVAGTLSKVVQDLADSKTARDALESEVRRVNDGASRRSSCRSQGLGAQEFRARDKTRLTARSPAARAGSRSASRGPRGRGDFGEELASFRRRRRRRRSAWRATVALGAGCRAAGRDRQGGRGRRCSLA